MTDHQPPLARRQPPATNHPLWIVLLIGVLSGNTAQAQPRIVFEAGERQVGRLVERLGPSHTLEERVAAAQGLGHLRGRYVVAAQGQLESLAASSREEDELRAVALRSLALIADAHRQECPAVVVESLASPRAIVRETAASQLYFNAYRPEDFERLLRASRALDRHVRSRALNALHVAAHDETTRAEATKRLEEALTSREFLDRHAAAGGLWRLARDPAAVLPHYLMHVAGPLPSDVPTDIAAPIQEEYARRLAAFTQLFPEETARTLVAALASTDSRTRRNALEQLPRLAPTGSATRVECQRLEIVDRLHELADGANADEAAFPRDLLAKWKE